MRSLKLAIFASLVALSGAAVACNDHAPGKEPAKRTVGRESAWVAGEVRDVDLDEGTITLAHARIGSLRMEAMGSMQFRAASTALISDAKPGDKVKFRVKLIGEQPTVTLLTVVAMK